MEFSNRLKGAMTQVLLKALLEDVGYRIIPLGIEELVREVSVLDKANYKALNLSENIRNLPDFLVGDVSLSMAKLVEVKYRKKWDKETAAKLEDQLLAQVKQWAPLYVMVFLGSPAKSDSTLPSSWMGIVRLGVIDNSLCLITADGEPYRQTTGEIIKWRDASWKNFDRVQDVFPALSAKEKYFKGTLLQARIALKQLTALDVFE